MLDICNKEGLSMNQATMDALVQVGGRGSQLPDTSVWATRWRLGGAVPALGELDVHVTRAGMVESHCLTQACAHLPLQTANNGDIRLILGQLQMIRLRARALSYDQVCVSHGGIDCHATSLW
jgi:hypothetical protein